MGGKDYLKNYAKNFSQLAKDIIQDLIITTNFKQDSYKNFLVHHISTAVNQRQSEKSQNKETHYLQRSKNQPTDHKHRTELTSQQKQ